MTNQTWMQQEANALEQTAFWRATLSDRHPDDERNLKAAELLSKLAAELRQHDGRNAFKGFESFHDQLFSTRDPWNSGAEDVLSDWAFCRSAIGFRVFPVSAEEYLELLVKVTKATPQLAPAVLH